MKRIVISFAVIALILMGTIYVNADIGMREEPEYDVVTGTNGTNYYNDEDLYNAQSPSGKLPGGLKFYVWVDWGSGKLWGTTDPSLSFDQSEQFVYIRSEDVLDLKEDIPPEQGQDQGSEMEAVTTDELNIRYGPGTGFSSKGVLKKGTAVTYRYKYTRETNDSDNAEWVYVSAGGKLGWVSAKYLKANKKTENGSEKKEEASAEPAEGGVAVQINDNGSNGSVTGKRYFVAGVICICLGTAILIAAIAFYILRNRKHV